MSKAYPDLIRNASSLKPYGVEESPNAILLTDRKAVMLSAVESTTLALMLVWGAVRINQTGTAGAEALWVWLLSLGWLLAVRRVISRLRAKSVRVEFGQDHLTFSRDGIEEEVIPYAQIRSIQITGGVASKWLEIVKTDFTSQSWSLCQVFESRKSTEVKLVQRLGPRLPSSADFSRSVRPPQDLLGLVYDHFYQAPEVQMQPGLTYRYRSRHDLRHFLWNKTDGYSWSIGLVALLVPGITDAVFHADFQYFGLVLATSLVGLSAYWPWLLPKLQFAASLDDRFRLLPEGLEVTRRGRTWVVPMIETRRGIGRKVRLLYGEPKRYHGPNGAYYFDPRFIEPDV